MKRKFILLASLIFTIGMLGFITYCGAAIMHGRAYVEAMQEDKAQKYNEFIMRMAAKEAAKKKPNIGIEFVGEKKEEKK